MSAYIHLMNYMSETFGSPDPANLRLMDLNKKRESNPFILSICSFLANYSMQPHEIANHDE